MRKIRDVLRLYYENGRSHREIADSLGLGRSTVQDHLRRAQMAGITWSEAAGMDDAALQARLFRHGYQDGKKRPEPDFHEVHRELKRKGVTKQLLWQEYRARYPEGYEYSWFCEHYREFKKTLDPVLHQEYKAGELMLVDWAGMKVPIANPKTGEVTDASVFVAALGASNLTFAVAKASEELENFIAAHVEAFDYFGGVAEIEVIDNLKTGVTKANYYDPDINETFADMARHYGIVVLPTRVRAPRDKAKVETAVLIVERQILAPLRNRTFFSVAELNKAIAELLEALNSRPFQKLPGNRKSLFAETDQKALRPLPRNRYEFAHYKEAVVHPDCHIELFTHRYSVPFRFQGKTVGVRYNQNTVEVLYKNERIASHRRSDKRGGFTTVREHLPKEHQDYQDWPPERLLYRASLIGPATEAVVKHLLETAEHPIKSYRRVLGLFRLAKDYGQPRMEAACKRALRLNVKSYKSIKSILRSNLDKAPLPESQETLILVSHENIRGGDYYN